MCYEKLAHALMEMSHNMPSASWRTGNWWYTLAHVRGPDNQWASGISPRMGRPRTRSPGGQGQEKIDIPAQEGSEFTFPPPFCSI